jgi:hypothetical protein
MSLLVKEFCFLSNYCSVFEIILYLLYGHSRLLENILFYVCANCGPYFKCHVSIVSTLASSSYLRFFMFLFLMHSCLFKFTEFYVFQLSSTVKLLILLLQLPSQTLNFPRGVFIFPSVRELHFRISYMLSSRGLLWSVKQIFSLSMRYVTAYRCKQKTNALCYSVSV